MLYFSIQNARGQREEYPRLRGGLRTDGFILESCSDHSRIMLGSFSDRPRIVGSNSGSNNETLEMKTIDARNYIE